MPFSHIKELALFISDPRCLKYLSARHFTRIYFGNEFCDRLLPTKPQLRQILNFCNTQNLTFTLATPYCTNTTLKKLEPLLDCLPKGAEVVFNDFGLLKLIKARGLTAVLGRLLVSVTRDPRIPTNSKPYNFYYKANNLQPPFLNFLRTKQIFRIELDNIKQGYDFSPQNNIRLSLHFPYVYSSVTRKCIFANLSRPTPFFKVAPPCRFECHNRLLPVAIPGQKEPLYIKGTAEYYLNADESLFHDRHIDRLVYTPVFHHNTSKPYKKTDETKN